MYLKRFQQRVVDVFREFLEGGREEYAKAIQAKEQMGIDYNWVEALFRAKGMSLRDNPVNGLGAYYPRLVLKVPTGGGKTLLAVEAIREYQERFRRRRTGLVVWIVPSETIYSQTVAKLRDRTNPLRQLIDQSSGGRTIILEKGQRLNQSDIQENLVILFVMIQSVSRKNGKEALKVFQDSGGYEGFFPPDHRADLHGDIIKKFPNLDLIGELHGLIRTSLGNAIRVSEAFFIIDEIHKVFSDQARQTLDQLNPAFVLGLSATPKDNMNLLVSITGYELKEEEMVKLDLHIIPPHSSQSDDWKSMLRELKKHRDDLDRKAKKLHKEKGLYIRPIALIQVEATGKDQRGKGRVHSLDAKDYLIELGVTADQIAIKTSAQNDIEDVDLFSSDCPILYVITKDALREGWDCSFAYLLGIIPNANSDSGVTQLIGRILRQPGARKTGVAELDESYVYFTKGDVRPMLEKVAEGFKNEGLEDLVGRVAVSSGSGTQKQKIVRIKHDFKKHQYAFYLPVWVMTNTSTNQVRRFSYSADIKPAINLAAFRLDDETIDSIHSSLSETTRDRPTFAITITEEKKASIRQDGMIANGHDSISIDYMTRRYSELTENAFLARRIAQSHIESLQKRLGRQQLKDHFGYIVSQLAQRMEEERRRQEEQIFLGLIEKKKLVLAVSTDPDVGWQIPQKEEITAPEMTNPYRYYLFDDVDISSMNNLERQVGDALDRQSKILWWFRNKTGKDWYSIQGWRQNRIWPDFVAAKKDGDRVEVVYVIESKGEHLLGNMDTIYKKKVMDLMTDQKKQKKIQKYEQPDLPFGNVSEAIEAHLIEEGKTEETIGQLFL